MLGCKGNVRHAQISDQQYDEPEEVHPRSRIYAREDEFEEAKDGVERVLGYVGPERKSGIEA